MARAVRYTCAITTRRRRDCAKGVLAGEKIANTESVAMTYSYTQISQYLTCPRRYRHRYLDGWQEKDLRAAMLFGRAFEQALAARSVTRMRQRCCSSSGLPAKISCWSTLAAAPGTACCSRACSCWSVSLRMAG